jgi:hypothetical protein
MSRERFQTKLQLVDAVALHVERDLQRPHYPKYDFVTLGTHEQRHIDDHPIRDLSTVASLDRCASHPMPASEKYNPPAFGSVLVDPEKSGWDLGADPQRVQYVHKSPKVVISELA